MSQWFYRRATHCASGGRRANAAGLMGTHRDHKAEASSDLEVGVVESARGAVPFSSELHTPSNQELALASQVSRWD